MKSKSILLFAASIAAIFPAQAENIFWDGSDSISWNLGANWAGNAVPANNITTDTAVFNGTTAYANQPSLDIFTVQSVKGLSFGGASTVATTLSTSTGTTTNTAASTSGSSSLTMDTTNLSVGQLITGAGIATGTFITSISGNTVGLSRNTSGTTAINSTISVQSSLRIGNDGITLEANTPNIANTVTAPITLATNQIWNNQASRTMAIQGSINLNANTLTLNGTAGSTISFNGATTVQSIGGSGNIIVDTAGTVSFGPGSGGRQVNTFTGGVTLNSGTIALQGGNSGGGGSMGGLGTGLLTINGGSISGGGNINGHELTISGQKWNADWSFTGGRNVQMGTGEINLGTTAGTSRILTVSSGTNALTLGGNIVDGTTANSLVKEGTSELILTGNVSTTGDTIVNNGMLTFGETSTMKFYIGADTVSNQIDGLGTGTVALNGSFIFDLSSSATAMGSSWEIVNTSLNETYGSTFGVLGFTQNGDTWSDGTYSFSQTSGMLTVVPEPSTALLGAVGILLLTRRKRTC